MAVEKAISYEQARKKINKAAPKGHQLAFITPAEAKMLKDKGGSGEMTEAGIKSYRGHHGGGGGGSSSSGSSGSSGGGQGGDKKGRKSSKVAQKKSKSFSEKLAEKRAKNEAQRAQVKANQAAARAQNEFNRATGFMTKKGFLRDKFGNIVRSKTQVDRFNEKKEREKALRDMFASQIQAQEAKQVTPTFSGLKGFLDRTRRSLGRGPQTQANLDRLVDINRALGDFDYTGMGIGNQLRAQAGDLAAGIPGLAKIGGALAGGPLGVAGLIASGGKGLVGLLVDRLGIGQDDEDSKPTIADVSNERPGFLSGIASALRLGEGSDFTTGPTIKRPFDLVRRGPGGGGGGGRPVTPRPGGFTPPPVTPRDPNAIPVIGKPVDNRMLNQYLALAGFTPQEIQLMPESFRFLD